MYVAYFMLCQRELTLLHDLQVSMAMQDFSNRKALDRVVRDLEKIGHVSDSTRGAVVRC